MFASGQEGGVLDPSRQQLNLGSGATAQGMAKALQLTAGNAAAIGNGNKDKAKKEKKAKTKGAKEVPSVWSSSGFIVRLMCLLGRAGHADAERRQSGQHDPQGEAPVQAGLHAGPMRGMSL